jgi:uncharacterized membrane protein YkoI
MVLAVAVTAGVLAGPAAGDDARPGGADHPVVGAQSLDDLLARVRADFPGRILEVELEDEDEGGEEAPLYEVKVLTADGHVLKLEYDAITLDLLKAKGRGSREREHDD